MIYQSGLLTVRTHATRPVHINALPNQVSIAKLDLVDDYVLVVNSTSDAVSLDGWALESSRGEQLYYFDSALQLQPSGGCIVVTSGSEDTQTSALAEVRAEIGDRVQVHHAAWTKRYIWNNQGDTARLLSPEKVVDEVEASWSEDDEARSRQSRPRLCR